MAKIENTVKKNKPQFVAEKNGLHLFQGKMMTLEQIDQILVAQHPVKQSGGKKRKEAFIKRVILAIYEKHNGSISKEDLTEEKGVIQSLKAEAAENEDLRKEIGTAGVTLKKLLENKYISRYKPSAIKHQWFYMIEQKGLDLIEKTAPKLSAQELDAIVQKTKEAHVQ